MMQVTQLKSGIASANWVRDLLGAVRMSRRYSGTWAHTGIRHTKLFGKLCLKCYGLCILLSVRSHAYVQTCSFLWVSIWRTILDISMFISEFTYNLPNYIVLYSDIYLIN